MFTSHRRDLWVQIGTYVKRYWRRIAVLVAIIAVMGFSGMVLQKAKPGVRHSTALGVASNGPAAQSATSFGTVSDSAHAGLQMQSSSVAKIAASTSAAQRKVIQQASLTVTLPHVKEAADLISTTATRAGGYMQSLQWSNNNSESVVQMTVRVPVTVLSSFLSTTKALGTVTNFNQTGNDVTDQYNGLQNTIAQLKDEATAYTRLYERAQNMQDMLVIQDALSKINAQLEESNANLRDMNRQVQLATVNVTLSSTLPGVTKPQPISAVQALYQSLGAVRQSALALLTLIAWLLPWVVLLMLGWGGWRLWAGIKGGQKP